MYKKQWRKLEEELRGKYGAGVQHWQPLSIPADAGVRVRSNRKADKGAVGLLRSFSNSMVTIETTDGRTLTMAINSIDLLDETGELAKDGPRDMLGEPLAEGAFIAYSQGRYRTGHDMAIGRITGFTKRGTIEIECKVQNGIKQKATAFKSKDTVDPDRCVKLPVNEDRMMMAILTDFDSINGAND